MASLTYTPTAAVLTTFNAASGAASGPSHNTKNAAKGTLAAAAVVLDLRGCKGIPLVSYVTGVTMFVSTDPFLDFDSASRDWTEVVDGDGFADCPAFIAFQGTGAWELMVAA